MSWYNRFIIITITILTLGCTAKEPIAQASADAQVAYNLDFVYLVGIDCELRGEYQCAIQAYQELYQGSKQKIFLKNLIGYAAAFQDYTIIKKYVDDIEDGDTNDTSIAKYLIPYYIDNKNFAKAKEIAKINLKNNKTENNLKIVLSLYPDTKELTKVFEEIGGYDELLIDIYSQEKAFKKAEITALKLYKKTNNPTFLAQSALYLYEYGIKDEKTLSTVFSRFEKSVYSANSPILYNYYGYTLIDHDKDLDKGISLIKKALEFEPKSEYYLDSLAWGYYEKGDCREAFLILDTLKDKKQKEIQKHIKEVKKCKY